VDAGKNFNKRAFARPILPGQDVHFAREELELGIRKNSYAGKTLADSGHFKKLSCVCLLVSHRLLFLLYCFPPIIYILMLKGSVVEQVEDAVALLEFIIFPFPPCPADGAVANVGYAVI